MEQLGWRLLVCYLLCSLSAIFTNPAAAWICHPFGLTGDYEELLEEAAERPVELVHQSVAPAPPAPSGASFTRVGVIGAIALVSGIGLFFVIRKLAAGQLPQVQEVRASLVYWCVETIFVLF